MSVVADNEGVSVPYDHGAPQQCFLPASLHGLASSVPASGSIKSIVIKSLARQMGGVCLTSSQAGRLSVQRYLDQGGQVPAGAPITVAFKANIAATAIWSDKLPFRSFQIEVTNAADTDAELSDVGVMLQSA